MTDVHMTADALATLVLRVHQAAREETAVPAVLTATDLPSPPAAFEELRPGDAEFDKAHAALLAEVRAAKAEADRLAYELQQANKALKAVGEQRDSARAELEAVKAETAALRATMGSSEQARCRSATQRIIEEFGSAGSENLEEAVERACRIHTELADRYVELESVLRRESPRTAEAVFRQLNELAAEVVHPESRPQSDDAAAVDYVDDAAVKVRPDWLELVASGVEAGVSFRELLATDEVLDAIEAAAPFELEIMDLYDALGLSGQNAPHVFGTLRAGLRRRRLFVAKARDKVWEVGRDEEPARPRDVVEPDVRPVAETVTPPLAAAVAEAGGELTLRLDAWAAVLGQSHGFGNSLIPALREAARDAGLIAQRTPDGLYTVRVARTGEAAA